MTSKILFLILMSAFFFVTMILHRSRRQFMTRFYLRMTALVTARKLYRLMLLILLYVFTGFDVPTYIVGIAWLVIGLIIGAVKSKGYKEVPEAFKNLEV